MTAAVILAAGRGSRLGRSTKSQPKACVRVAGRALLDWHLDALRASGIARIVVVGGYRATQLARPGVELVVAGQWTDQGPLASLVAAEPSRFGTDFIVLYADSPHHPRNIRRMVQTDADIAVAGDRGWRRLWTERHGDPLFDAETYRVRGADLVSIGAAPATGEDVEAQFAGLVRFSRAGWAAAGSIERAASDPRRDMTGFLSLLLRQGVRIADVPIDGGWCEIDSENDLRLARARLAGEPRWSHDFRVRTGDASWA